MSTKTKKKTPKKENRFSEIIDRLNKSEAVDILAGYNPTLDSIVDEDQSPEPIPFPYGGSSDFGKWANGYVVH